MPITLTADQRAALRRNAIGVRTLMDIYLDSGRYSFWDGWRNWTYGGAAYLAAAEFCEMSAIQTGQDLGAEGITVKLNGTKLLDGVPGGGDPGALFGQIEAETYQLRRVNIQFAFIDAETRALLFVIRRYSGLIDQFRQSEEMGADGRAQAILTMSLESVARRYGNRGGRTRSHEDQNEIWPGDTGLKFVSASIAGAGAVYWGRSKPAAVGVHSGGSGGVFGRVNDAIKTLFG